eukprot:766294-Hanusia_phi.AAC.4
MDIKQPRSKDGKESKEEKEKLRPVAPVSRKGRRKIMYIFHLHRQSGLLFFDTSCEQESRSSASRLLPACKRFADDVRNAFAFLSLNCFQDISELCDAMQLHSKGGEPEGGSEDQRGVAWKAGGGKVGGILAEETGQVMDEHDPPCALPNGRLVAKSVATRIVDDVYG